MELFKTKPLDFHVDDNGCFVCTSHAPCHGYPIVTFKQKRYRASRHVYTQMFGEIPKGLLVRHKCDNRACINPEHLELGTHQENSNDMKLRKRHKPNNGEKCHFAKLNEEQVKELRKLHATEKYNYHDLSSLFHISYRAAYEIVTRKTWKHI